MSNEALASFAKDVLRMAIFPVAAAAMLVVLRSFSWWGFVVLGFLILIAAVIAAIAVMVMGVMAVMRRDWRSIAAGGVALVLAVPALMSTRTVTLPGDYVHLAIMYPYYAMLPEYRSGKAFSIPWTNEGFISTQGCDRSAQFDPSGKTKAEERRVAPDAHYYYNWLSIRPLFMNFSVREDCYF